MAWDDIVFGVLTGGLYNAGKALYNAGEAAEEAGEAAEQAGVALAVIGSTVEEVGKQLDSLLEEAEELITINRLTPRDESDLWEEEKDRLDDLRERKTQLENQLAELGVSEPGDFSFDIWDFLTDMQNMMKKIQLISALVVVNNEIHEILYSEPGVITTAIYNASESLERFNTIEQPKIEDILDSLDDNLEVTEETIKEIKKLFVIKKKIPVLESDLTKELKDKLKVLDLDAKYYQGLINKRSVVSTQLIEAMDKIPVAKFDISEKGVKVEGARISKNPGIHSGSIKNPGVKKEETPENTKIRATDTTRKTIGSDLQKDEFRKNIKESGTAVKKDIETLRQLNLALTKKRKISRATIQPQGAKVSAALNTKFDGYQRTYAFSRAQIGFYERELLKNARKVDRIKFRWEDEPGVIPQTLEELKDILERVRTQEQPKVETILDTLNANLEESKETLSKINTSLDSTQGAISFLKENGTMIKLGLGVFGAVVFLDLLFALFVLIRMTLGL